MNFTLKLNSKCLSIQPNACQMDAKQIHLNITLRDDKCLMEEIIGIKEILV